MPRRDYSKVAFATTGDTNVIPTPTQPDGSVSLQQGFGFDYQRDNGAGGGTPDPLAKNIDREDMNGILNEITASVGEIQQNGFPIWVTTAAPYPIYATVRHNDINWRSEVTNNSDEPGVGPGATSWLNADLNPPGRLLGCYLISTTQTFAQRFPEAASAYTELFSGGGGGGGAQSTATGNNAAGLGGSAGGKATWYGPISDLNGKLVTIGAGGLGASSAAGGNGGPSSVGTLIQVPGGVGGGPGVNSTVPWLLGEVGNSVAPIGGNVSNVSGQSGGIAFALSLGSPVSGRGGSSTVGTGGNSRGTIRGNGAGGQGFASGGGGAVETSAGPGGLAGGSGMGGLMIVWEYSQ